MLAVYLPYGIFPDWAYLRFLLPGLAVAFVLVGALTAEAAERLPEWVRGPALIVGMAAVCTANVVAATREQVFNLRFYESRYRTVGHYLKETLPPNPVVITFQESGSIHYYTGAPISRWDYMPHDLEDSRLGLPPARPAPDHRGRGLGAPEPAGAVPQVGAGRAGLDAPRRHRRDHARLDSRSGRSPGRHAARDRPLQVGRAEGA